MQNSYIIVAIVARVDHLTTCDHPDWTLLIDCRIDSAFSSGLLFENVCARVSSGDFYDRA